MMYVLERQAAFKTGCSKGVSFACALYLAKVAANIFLTELNKIRLKAAVTEIENQTVNMNDPTFFALHDRRE